jgi:hypothetical protein
MTGNCRFCETPLRHSLADLGVTPLSNSFVSREDVSKMEPFFPLHAFVCEECFLVQLDEFVPPEAIFSDYAYFSSYSETWLKHAETYTEQVCQRFGYGPSHQVVEIASNDGYLLRCFKERGIPVLGIEPARNVADVAERAGIPTRCCYFGERTARGLLADGVRADLLVGNNVLAHVPHIKDFVRGIKLLLAPYGTVTLEFPHLLRLLAENQFDTIYHEHFSYFSLHTARSILLAHGLDVVEVEELGTHGGSLRVFARHAEEQVLPCGSVASVLEEEERFGLLGLSAYASFSERVKETKRALLSLLIELRRQGKSIVGYGAPAKGNTLLNYCGIRNDFIDYTVDRNPYKQGRLLPGTRIEVRPPEAIAQTRPDYVLVLPWNLRDEILAQLDYVRAWGAKFILPIPKVEVVS